MHPAYSVILFTTASGLGYGLLMLLGLFAPLGLIVPDQGFGLAAFAFAFATVITGLLASTFHLGHPERAWRALSQWRSSWLSREGVVAILTFVPTGLFALGWVLFGENAGLWGWIGLAGAVLSLITVLCTGMIYASLPTIRAWSDPLVPAIYIALSLMTGSLWFSALATPFGLAHPMIAHLPMALVIIAWVLKAWYWSRLDSRPPLATAATATGLGTAEDTVRLLEAPHTQENFVMREMGYRIARRHARKLRKLSQILAFLVPLVLIEAVIFVPESAAIASLVALIAALSATGGVAIERWLFFAEARHVVTLYYGADRV